MLPNAPEDAIDLIKNLLRFNPDKRLTVEEALMHPYVAKYRDIKDEIICNKKITVPIDDNKKFSIREYRNKLYVDIHNQKRELKK